MSRVPVHIPIHIRVHDVRGSPPDVTVEPTCVHASTRDTLDWVLQGGGQFTIELLDGKTPFGSTFGMASDRAGCCSALIAGEANPGNYHYSVCGDATTFSPVGAEGTAARETCWSGPKHFVVDGPEIVLE